MCEMCFYEKESSYRACDGCSNLIEKQDLIVYDVHREWKHLAEFIEQKKSILLFCKNCVDAMNAYQESTRAQVMDTEMNALYLPEPRKIKKPDAIPVAIRVEYKTLGLKCAREVYGDEAVEEILQGFVYWHKREGNHVPEQIKRLTLADTDETICCERCWRRLWMCNSMEVTR
jgi:hypothetical protein